MASCAQAPHRHHTSCRLHCSPRSRSAKSQNGQHPDSEALRHPGPRGSRLQLNKWWVSQTDEFSFLDSVELKDGPGAYPFIKAQPTQQVKLQGGSLQGSGEIRVHPTHHSNSTARPPVCLGPRSGSSGCLVHKFGVTVCFLGGYGCVVVVDW